MRSAALWISLTAAVLIAVLAARTPAPSPATAPASAFSAARAFPLIQAIARAPHPTGSAEAARVRDVIAAEMRAQGLRVLVRPGTGVAEAKWAAGRVSAAHVENLVAILPGRDRGLPALALMSHSDSVPSSPGAADDAAGVAASIEVVRAIAASGSPVRDVMLVVTDGEEAGLLGAEAFFATDPLAKHVGAVINLETRGGGGRAQMFETAPKAGGWVELYRRTAKNGGANSLMPFVYHRMPNGTDVTEAVAGGVPGLNVGFTGRQFDYHTAHATPAALDRGSLQSLGDQALGPARTIAFARHLPALKPDLVYSTPPWLQLLGSPVIAYPPAVGWALALIEAALFVFVAWRAWDLGLASLRGAGFGVLVVLGMTAAVGLGLQLTAGPFGSGYADVQQRYAVLGRYPWALAGASFIAFGLALTVLRLARARCGVWSLWLGALGLGLALSFALQADEPTTAFVLAWPLLPALLGATAAVLLGGDLDRAGALAVVAAFAVLGLSDVAGLGASVFSAVGVDMPATLAVVVPLAAMLLIPLAAGEGRLLDGAAPLVALTLGLVALAGATAPRPGSLKAPALTQAAYLADPQRGRYLRVSALDRLDGWSRWALSADGGVLTHRPEPPFLPFPVHTAAARPAAVCRPRITVERERGRALLRIAPGQGGRELRIRVRSSSPLAGVTVQGRAVRLLDHAGQGSSLSFAAPPATGVEVAFASPPPGTRVEVQALEVAEGWPAGARVPPRPATLQPWGWSDTTQVIARRAFAW